jgi:Spy/CpxP family protein refolding chaperone
MPFIQGPMKSMLRISLFTTALAMAILPALRAADEASPPAAGDKNPEQRPPGGRREAMRNRLQHLSETLNLAPEQKDQIRAIFKEHAPQIQAIRNDEARARRSPRQNAGAQAGPADENPCGFDAGAADEI